MARIKPRPYLVTPFGVCSVFLAMPFMVVIINLIFASFVSFIFNDWEIYDGMMGHPLSYFIWGIFTLIFTICVLHDADEQWRANKDYNY